MTDRTLDRLLLVLGLIVAFAATSCASQWVSAPRHRTFPLIGRHQDLGCDTCHGAGEIGPLPTACAACHLGDRPPDHYEGDCGQCHVPTDWNDIHVDHDWLPLTQAHDLGCGECHAPDTFTGLSSVCMSCHEQDRKDAEHFPGQDCGACHVATRWADANVDHSFFPLTNAHDLSCGECHVGGNLEGLDPACASCHEADRKDPSHYPGEDCGDCHVPTEWADATFDHSDYFPTPHRGVSACESCHPDSSDYSQFVCTDCHHKSETDGHHREVGGYTYVSSECYRCHPDGRAEDD